MIPQLIRDWLQDCEDVPLTPETLKNLEAELDAELPQDYRDFLLQFNGGEFREVLEIKFPVPIEYSDAVQPRRFLGVPTDSQSSDGIAGILDNFDRFLPNEWLPIVECEGADGYIILKFRGPGRHGFEGVWHWTVPYGPSYEEPPQFLANTFTEFLQKIEINTDEDFAEPETETKPLFLAIERGNLAEIETYLSRGGDPNVRNERGLSLVAAASEYKWPQIVHLLLEHSADPNLPDKQGETAVHKAAQWSLDCLKLLVAAGADTGIRDKAGKRPVDFEYILDRIEDFLLRHTK